MAALSQHTRGFTTCYAATDDKHALCLQHGIIGSHALACRLRIHRTVDHGILLNAAHAALLAGDTGADAFTFAAAKLVHVIGVRQQWAAKTDDIAHAVHNSAFRHIRIIHAASAKHRHIYIFLHKLSIGHIEALFLVHRRMTPPPGIVRADVDIERIIAVGNEQLCRFHALGQVSALFFKLFSRQRPFTQGLDKALRAVAQHHGEVLPAAALDLLDDLTCKTQAVFKAAAVLIRALVEQRNCKLVDKVALMYCVNLHTVEAGALCIVSALAEIAHKLVDLVDCQRAAGLV